MEDVDAAALDEEASKKEDKKDVKLVLEEKTAEGHISWQSCQCISDFFSVAGAYTWLTILTVKMYIEALGGPIFWPIFVLATFFKCTIEVPQP